METSLKTGFAQKSELPKIWGGCSPPRPPGPYAYGKNVYIQATLKDMKTSISLSGSL